MRSKQGVGLHPQLATDGDQGTIGDKLFVCPRNHELATGTKDQRDNHLISSEGRVLL